jgi:hypothetical protein
MSPFAAPSPLKPRRRASGAARGAGSARRSSPRTQSLFPAPFLLGGGAPIPVRTSQAYLEERVELAAWRPQACLLSAGNESDATASARLMTTVKSGPPPTSIDLATFGVEIACHRGNWGSAGNSRPSPAFTLRLGRSRRRPRQVAARGSGRTPPRGRRSRSRAAYQPRDASRPPHRCPWTSRSQAAAPQSRPAPQSTVCQSRSSPRAHDGDRDERARPRRPSPNRSRAARPPLDAACPRLRAAGMLRTPRRRRRTTGRSRVEDG